MVETEEVTRAAPTRMRDCAPGILAAAAVMLIGVFVFCTMALPEWRTYFAARRWVPADAVVAHVRIEEEWSDTTVYRVVCRYQYRFKGVAYEGSRVSTVDADARRSGGVPRRHFDTLEAHRASGRPVRAWVNPDDPAESVLFREVTLESIGILWFCLMWLAAGGVVLVSAVEGPMGRVLGADGWGLLQVWATTLFVCAFFGPLPLFLRGQPPEAIILGGLLWLIAPLLLVAALAHTACLVRRRVARVGSRR